MSSVETISSAPNWGALIAGYTEESSIASMPPISPQMEHYKAIEATGMLEVLAAWDDDKLAGFMVYLKTVFLHYGAPVFVTESFFVAPEYRKKGVGIRLIRAFEARARETGAAGVFLSAPTGGRLAEVAPRLGYEHTNETFFKPL